MNNKKQIALIIPLLFLLVAILFSSLPYGFYTFLRLIVFISALFYVWLTKDENKNWLIAIFIVIAILFNPVIPVFLNRPIWLVIDIFVAAIYSFLLLILYKANR